MKKIINGRKYDTDTATEVHSWEENAPNDFSHIEETLYRKRTGEYFLLGYGGPMTRYAERERYGSGYMFGSTIIPMTYDEASEWAEARMSADEYEAEFGEVPEDDSTEVVFARVPSKLAAKLERAAREGGKSKSEALTEILEAWDRQ